MQLEDIIPTAQQIEILYTQLKSRIHKVSHKKIPPLEDHKLFVKNNPYREWYIVKDKNCIIGNVYLQFDNSIGLNCKDDISEIQIKNILNLICSKVSPLEAKPSVRNGNFFINVASSNKLLQRKLSSIGLEETQRTYIIDKMSN